MSGSCPYCGAKLNYGIKFCVVCGRPIQGSETGRMGGGMRSGIRPADVTRRLEDLMTAARFRRSKRQVTLDQSVHLFSLNAFSVVTGIALLFCAVKLSLDGGFIHKEHKMVAPFSKILNDIGANKVNFKNGTVKADDKSDTSNKQTGKSDSSSGKKKSGKSQNKRNKNKNKQNQS
ncbi:MAG: hypothetical protein IPK73_15480 [Candidatus Obscuribacter sp.]|nr:hypothetical protein [Candidatus Obscuribacter sp.]MBK9278971.1 hypothetical protein [Candidatus Obscuribacter sp.]